LLFHEGEITCSDSYATVLYPFDINMRGLMMSISVLRKFIVVLVATALAPCIGSTQLITPARENISGGSVVQLGGIGSISAADLEDAAKSASAQFTVVLRPSRWLELYGSFNQGAGLTEVAADSFKISGLLYPEASNSGFLGQIETGPYFLLKLGGLDSRVDLTGFASFATRTNRVSRENEDYSFGGGYFGAGARAVLSIYTQENIFRFLGGLGYNRIFISEQDLQDARVALNREQLPQNVAGYRPVVAVQINALVIEAQFPTLRGDGGVDEPGLTGFSSIVRFYVVGKFLSFGSHDR
jgi:hypothetical protein